MSETGSQLYHVTNIHNLGSIFQTALVCREAAVVHAGWTQFPVIEEHLRKKPVPLNGKSITEFVPLSFCLKSPFLYDLTDEASSWGQHRHRRGYHAPVDNDDVAILCLDGAQVLGLDGVIYTDGDDRSQSANFYDGYELPSHVDWSAVTASTCFDDDIKMRRAAEVLVPGHVPSRFIVSVILYSYMSLEYVQDVLCSLADRYTDDDRRFAYFMNVLKVQPDVYFPQYADSADEARRGPTGSRGEHGRG